MFSRNGLIAEWYFLQACRNIGFNRINKTHPFKPHTVRKANYHEDYIDKIDFFITLGRDNNGHALPVVPIQLTLQHRRNGNTFRYKKKHARDNNILLIMPTAEFGVATPTHKRNRRSNFVRMLRGAARGDTVMLWVFYMMIKRKCEEYTGKEVRMPVEFSLEHCTDKLTRKDINLITMWLPKRDRVNIQSIRQNYYIGDRNQRFLKVKEYLSRAAA